MGSVHVVDTTMFWSPTGGGVRRYLQTKQAWLAGQAGWTHTIAVPTRAAARIGEARLPALPLPFSGGYRLPLRRRAVADRLVALRARPDRGRRSVRDRVGRARRRAAQGHPGGRLLPFEPRVDGAAGRRQAPRRRRSACRARLRAPRLPAASTACFAPSESMRRHLVDWGVEHAACQPLGVDTQTFHPSRASARWRERMGVGRRHARARLRRPLRAGKASRRAGRRRSSGSATRTCCSRSAAARRRRARRTRPRAAVHRRRRRARDRARQRRRVRARRRPGDVRPVGARGDGLRHAGRRAPRRWPCRAGRSDRRHRRRVGPRRGFRRSDRGAVRARPRRAPAGRADARRSERLGARAAGAADPVPQPAAGHADARSTGRVATDGGARCDEHAERLRRAPRRRRRHARRLRARAGCARTRSRRCRSRCSSCRASITRRRRRRSSGGSTRAARPATSWPCTATPTSTRARPHGAARPAAAPRLHARRRRVLGARRAERGSAGCGAGIDWFERHGWPLRGFVAPAWLLGRGRLGGAAHFREFDYTSTLRHIDLLPDDGRITSQSLVYSTSSAWRRRSSIAWAAVSPRRLAGNPVLRLELHPRDADDAGVRRSWQRAPRDARCGTGQRADGRATLRALAPRRMRERADDAGTPGRLAQSRLKLTSAVAAPTARRPARRSGSAGRARRATPRPARRTARRCRRAPGSTRRGSARTPPSAACGRSGSCTRRASARRRGCRGRFDTAAGARCSA